MCTGIAIPRDDISVVCRIATSDALLGYVPSYQAVHFWEELSEFRALARSDWNALY